MNANHLSFGAQAMRYFQRPHDAVLRQSLDVPAAWRGAEMRQRDDWIVRLTPAEIAELERAADAATARGLGLDAVRREDFPLPTLARTIAGWSRELAVGRGFLLLRGLPVHRWGEARASLVYWGDRQVHRRPGRREYEERGARPRHRLEGACGESLGGALPHRRRRRILL